MSHERFADRRDAGRRLAGRLESLQSMRPLVLGLPRGGIPVAAAVAKSLGAELDVLGVRKLGAPHNPEFGFGAIAEDGRRVVDAEAAAVLRIRNGKIERIYERERIELDRLIHIYRGDRPLPDMRGRTVIIVDDGAATGLTQLAAVRSVRRSGPRRVIVALPVCSLEALSLLRGEADQAVCVRATSLFEGVGAWYRDFDPVSDEEVVDAVGHGRPSAPAPARVDQLAS